MDVPSMVRRSGGKLIVRQVVSGRQEVLGESIKLEVKSEPPQQQQPAVGGDKLPGSETTAPGRAQLGVNSWKANGAHEPLPQCKVKRNYSCARCSYFTQNPRRYLTHLRDTHGEKIVINECQRCLYASRHHQKLVRHMRMVHGTTETGQPSFFAARHRRRVKKESCKQRNYPAGVSPVDDSLCSLTPSEQDADTFSQQLVASDLPKLLEQIEKSWSSSVAVANIELLRNALKLGMANLQNVVNAPEELRDTEKTARRSMEDNDLTPRKRHRPIPNLIPLASPPVTGVAVRPEKEPGLKPVPMSVLMPQEATSPGQPAADHFPSNLSPAERATQMKCTFCELSFESTVDLANHIESTHKEDLFTSLLQKSIDESQQNIFPQSDADSASNELWKSLLEANFSGSENAPKPSPSEPDGKQVAANASEDDDVEILESRTETYCGIETAPGYGEVTSKILSTDANASALMKKVFKCPHCSFWASTASRFHVHIVGHLNKKPFECSLCSYRSNWRWDITKHIRLKTVRDPSHKNAGVLMNDETGRRNYTKYNKYITLMQIADSNAKDSSTYAKSFAEGSVADLMTACSTYNIDLSTFANIPGFKLLLDDKHIGEEVPINNGPKQHGAFHLKCHICEFRTSSKEELLVHTTTSHSTGTATVQLDDVIECDPSGTPTAESNAQPSSRGFTVIGASTIADHLPQALSASTLMSCSLSQSAANTSSECSTNGTILLLTTSGAGDRPNPTEQADRPGEGEGSSQRVAMPTWRHNAPYRCGHCHQVSNWKHVIQRHCRLKHNGNVLIEHIHSEKDDPSDSEGQQAQRSMIQSQHSFYVVEDGQSFSIASTDRARQSIETLVSSTVPPPLAPFALDDGAYSVANSLEPIVEILDKDPSDLVALTGTTLPSTVLVSSGTVAPSLAGEQLDCVSCQFHAETVEQLTEHLEAHISNGQREGAYDIAPTTLLDPVPTVMYFCSKCPARFFDEGHVVEHEERHASGKGTVCPACSYVAGSDEEPGRHLEVHSAAYNKNTENLQIFLAESKDYPQPQLGVRESADGQLLWCVEPEVPETTPQRTHEPVSPKKSKRSKRREHRSVDAANDGEQQQPLRSIFLCEYCDHAFDSESDLNAHVRGHFSSILSAQAVAYYTSLSSTLNREKKLELVVSGTLPALPLHYVYDNTRRKDWTPFSKTENVLLQL